MTNFTTPPIKHKDLIKWLTIPKISETVVNQLTHWTLDLPTPMDTTENLTGTAVAKYYPTVNNNLKVELHCITAQKEYITKSLEELRFEDYMGRPQPSIISGTGFGVSTVTKNDPLTGLFGQCPVEVKNVSIEPNFTGIGNFGFPGGFSPQKPLTNFGRPNDSHRLNLSKTGTSNVHAGCGGGLLNFQNTNREATVPSTSTRCISMPTTTFYGSPQNTTMAQPILQPANTAGSLPQVIQNVVNPSSMPISGRMGGLSANYGYVMVNNNPQSGPAKTIHEQILARIACPYEENPLWKDLNTTTTSTTTTDVSTSVTNLYYKESILNLNSNQFRFPHSVKSNSVDDPIQQLSLAELQEINLDDNDFKLKPNPKSLLAKRIQMANPCTSSLPTNVMETVNQQNYQVNLLDEPSSSINTTKTELVPTIKYSQFTDDLHPTRIVQTRLDYYTIPSLDELVNYLDENGSCIVPNFTVGREGYGNVYYGQEIDVAGLNLDELVYFGINDVVIYPDDKNKPPIGHGLNRKAEITLDNVWPKDKITKEMIKDPQRLYEIDFQSRLRLNCIKNGTHFIDYRPETGSWKFSVKHF